MVGGFLTRLFGKPAPGVRNQPSAPDPPPPGLNDEPSKTLRESFAKREAYWASVGAVENDVLAYLVSPQLLGGPPWPTTRQAYRVIRTDDSVILATDGMSDPFEAAEGFGNGFEMELFVETGQIPETHAGRVGEIDGLKQSWAFVVLERVAEVVARAGGVTRQLDRYGSLSVELPGLARHPAIAEQVPARFIAADDTLGVLLGAPKPRFPAAIPDMPLSPVQIVPVVLLTAAELDYARAEHEAARAVLVERLGGASANRSDLGRDSVV